MRIFSSLSLSLILVIALVAACDSVDSMTSNDAPSSVQGDFNSSGEPFSSKIGQQLTPIEDCTDPGADLALCSGSFEFTPAWDISFVSRDASIGDFTRFTYKVNVPDAPNNSGKLFFEIPECCGFVPGSARKKIGDDGQWKSVSEGASGSYLVFNTNDTEDNEPAYYSYDFTGSVWTGEIAARFSLNGLYTNDVKIYGPGENPFHSISGSIFFDNPATDGSGPSMSNLLDGDDRAFSDDLGEIVTVHLYQGGTLDESGTYQNGSNLGATTTENGFYLFDGLLDDSAINGDYYIVIPDVGGYSSALHNTDDYQPAIADENYARLVGPVSTDLTDIDFGFVEVYDVSGFIFLDSPDNASKEGDGLMRLLEPGLEGVLVNLGDRSFTTGANGRYEFLGLRWGNHLISIPDVDNGVNLGLFSETGYIPIRPAAGREFIVFDNLVKSNRPLPTSTQEDFDLFNFGFEVNVQSAINAFSRQGAAITSGLPRAYWKVQATGKGSPKYQPDMSTLKFEELVKNMGMLLGPNGMSVFQDVFPTGEYSSYESGAALELLKTDSKQEPLEALRTQIFVALLNASFDCKYTIDPNACTLTDGMGRIQLATAEGWISTDVFIEHGITVYLNAGGTGGAFLGKIGSGTVTEGTRLLEGANGE